MKNETYDRKITPGCFQRLCFPFLAEVLVDDVPAVPPYISDRYKVGRMLGDGNFAVVRECVEHSTGREYALKIINKGKCRGKVSYKPVERTTHFMDFLKTTIKLTSCLWFMTVQLTYFNANTACFSLFLPVASILSLCSRST